MKKVLVVASVVSFIEWFNKENIDFLSDEMKCEVHIACNFDYMNDTDIDRTKKYIEKLIERANYKNQDTWNESTYLKEESFNHLQEIMVAAGELKDYAPYNDLVINYSD